MPFNILSTTAEDIVGATDATIQCLNGSNEDIVADFLDVPTMNARNALLMAQQLQLISYDNQFYNSNHPYAPYLVTSSLNQKATILRFFLEQYEPYKFFKTRLLISDSVQIAANQVKAKYGISTHRAEIQGTLVSLGTFTNSIISEGGGRYRIPDDGIIEYLQVVNQVIQERESTELYLRRRIGDIASSWINQQEILDHLVTAYQCLRNIDNDQRAPVVHAGNAIESFLSQIADHYSIDIVGANGINAKVERLSNQHHLNDKHKFILKYLGHIRNAADHGVDSSIGQSWAINKNTSIEYVHVSCTIINNIVNQILNNIYSV